MSKKRSLARLSVLVILLSFLAVKLPTSLPIRAAIIPHHLTAESFMADLGKKLAKQNISEIIIIGPNHNEIGDQHFSSETDLVTKDHACFAPLEVLKKYLPWTKISCILISSRSLPTEINSLAKKLSKTLGKSGVLVASVDFSHYQTLEQANENDVTTQKYLENFDSNSLLPLGNSYLDSPSTISVLFKFLSLNSINHYTLINHSNSALILNMPSSTSTTSYFEYIYY